MSVTFTAEMSAITGFAFDCGVHDNGMTAHRFGTYADAEAFLGAEMDANGSTGHLAVCGDEFCQESRMFILALEEAPAPEVNVTNTNALHLLGLLGIETANEYGEVELYGSMSGEDFMGRVLMASAVSPADAGVPATAVRYQDGEGTALSVAEATSSAVAVAERTLTVIDCGRREGYSEGRLAELHDLAQFSIATGRTVQWA